ncbi:MAG: beta-CASP ribonuclease aCPSF1 [Candidatus Aenigmatarchaeota archaeon]|nr:MAG: beta-CASP ribonuclease aCPSF1 [Candidatus Aenigmarchaeota archaeon]
MSILKELEKKLPKDASITEVKFEASLIVLYTKSKQFFRESEDIVKSIVSQLKKRIEIRPDLSITLEPEKAREFILKTVPEEAGIKAIYFEPELGKVVIECQKPGLVIGKGGETYRKLKNELFWLPKIERAPAIDSKIVRAVRNLLHTEIDYRKKFLNAVGQRINSKVLTEEERRQEWVRLSALGGFRQVGRSCLLVQTPHSSVMLDCGVDVGSPNGIPYLDAPEFDLDRLDAVFISHAHIDHLGFVPYLYEKGYKGPLYCSAPTRDLLVLLCFDYIDVCQKEGKKVWYSKKAIEKAVKHSITLEYGEVTDITPDIRLTIQPSGHLLGSALAHLHIGDGLHNILYTSDFKFGPTRLFEPAKTQFPRIETLIIESTYGGPEDVLPKRKEAEEMLVRLINETAEKGGKVLIPVFAVGRAQEIMAILAERCKYPVYLDGMVWDATAIHTAYPEHLSRYLQSKIFHQEKNPFLAEIFKPVAPKERPEIIDSSEPAVILATSGMLIGGPAIEYLKAVAPDPRNCLIFVGYQGEGTLGRRIQKGWREIPIRTEDGRTKTLELKLRVETVVGLTGHSGRNQILSYIRHLSSKPERVIVCHGEAKKCLALARDIHRIFRVETLAPRNLDAIRLR